MKQARMIAGLLACVSLTAPATKVLAQIDPITIISVGDSYASGQGAPDVASPFAVAGRWSGDDNDHMAVGCHRSNNAAPVKAVALLKAIRPVKMFHHFACSGAVITDLTKRSGQLDSMVTAVGAGGTVDALIISIGGNDINFAAVVGGCLVLPCEAWTPAAFPTGAVNLGPGLAALVTKVRGLSVTVRHVFITEYPDPSTTPFGPASRCGSPATPEIPGSGFENLDAIRGEVAASTVITPLNATLLAAVSGANTSGGGPVWHYVGGISAAFLGHGYCMGWPNPAPHMWVAGRMINTVTDSFLTQQDILGTMHPNVAGNDAAAVVIAASILANVPFTTTPMPTGSSGGAPGNPQCSVDSFGCPGFCGRHPKDKRCRSGDECLNRHLPGCR
jgi:hypothetical protein